MAVEVRDETGQWNRVGETVDGTQFYFHGMSKNCGISEVIVETWQLTYIVFPYYSWRFGHTNFKLFSMFYMSFILVKYWPKVKKNLTYIYFLF